MTRKHVTGLLIAATSLTAGTIAVVNAQDKTDEDALSMPTELPPNEPQRTPTSVRSADGTVFKIDDPKAYPDGDGFKTKDERVSYSLGRVDGKQLPSADENANAKSYGEGIRKGLAESNKDYATGYGQGFQLARQAQAQSKAGKLDIDAFIAGVNAALQEKDHSRSLGYLIGHGYHIAEIEIKPDIYLQGIDESITIHQTTKQAGENANAKPQLPKTKLTDEQVQETLAAFTAYRTELEKNKAIAKGQAYLDSLKPEDGWKKTESGLRYKVIKPGEGASPDSNDVVTVHYEGTLIDGTVFDSSYPRKQPLVHPANRLIAGWTEALQLMKPGAHFEIAVPYNLAYGEQGSGRSIPPYSTLKFKMEMISFESVENK